MPGDPSRGFGLRMASVGCSFFVISFCRGKNSSTKICAAAHSRALSVLRPVTAGVKLMATKAIGELEVPAEIKEKVEQTASMKPLRETKPAAIAAADEKMTGLERVGLWTEALLVSTSDVWGVGAEASDDCVVSTTPQSLYSSNRFRAYWLSTNTSTSCLRPEPTGRATDDTSATPTAVPLAAAPSSC